LHTLKQNRRAGTARHSTGIGAEFCRAVPDLQFVFAPGCRK